MNILGVRKSKMLNLKIARSLQSTILVHAARAMLCVNCLKLGGALAYLTAKIAEYFPISAKFQLY